MSLRLAKLRKCPYRNPALQRIPKGREGLPVNNLTLRLHAQIVVSHLNAG